MTYDAYGLRRFEPAINRVMAERVQRMTSPVRCTYCSRVYDLGQVEVTGRWTDCSSWNAPCCGRPVDDRGAGWMVRADYVELDHNGREKTR